MEDSTTDKQATDLVNNIQDVMLESKSDTQNLTDILAPPPDVPMIKSEGEDETTRTKTTLMYEMMAQEIKLQKEEEKYGIYMNTFGYEGNDSNLDPETESDSDATVYLYLGQELPSSIHTEVTPSGENSRHFPFKKPNNFLKWTI